VPYSKFLKKTKIITEPVSKINKDNIKAGKTTHPFDYLIICSGASNKTISWKAKNCFILKNIDDAKKVHDSLQVARCVTIVGGGYVGTEIAGELINKTDKHISLVEKSDRLLSRQYVDAGTLAHNYLTKKGVKLYFNQEIKKFQSSFALTSQREKIMTDLMIWCVGITPNTSFLNKYFKKNSYGQLITTPSLNLQGYKNIFAGGDITDIIEEKSAQNAEYHGEIIAKNILKSINKKKLVNYESKKRTMVISLGDYNSILVMNNTAFDGLIPAFMKKMIEKIIVWKYKYPKSKILIIQDGVESSLLWLKQKAISYHSKVINLRKIYKGKESSKQYDNIRSRSSKKNSRSERRRNNNSKRKRVRSKSKKSSKRKRS